MNQELVGLEMVLFSNLYGSYLPRMELNKCLSIDERDGVYYITNEEKGFDQNFIFCIVYRSKYDWNLEIILDKGNNEKRIEQLRKQIEEILRIDSD
jgi:hypothetical protein